VLMKKMSLLPLIALLLCISTAHAEVSKEKREEIEKMLRLTGMEKMVDQIKTQMISGLKNQITDVPETFWTKFAQKMDSRELIEKIIPVYDKYYTIEDLRAVNAFYASPAGQKVLSTMPQVVQESMKIGEEWGRKIGEKAMEEAKQESKGK